MAEISQKTSLTHILCFWYVDQLLFPSDDRTIFPQVMAGHPISDKPLTCATIAHSTDALMRQNAGKI